MLKYVHGMVFALAIRVPNNVGTLFAFAMLAPHNLGTPLAFAMFTPKRISGTPLAFANSIPLHYISPDTEYNFCILQTANVMQQSCNTDFKYTTPPPQWFCLYILIGVSF